MPVDLTRVIETSKHLHCNKMEVFKAFCDVCCSFQHMPWFTAAVLAHPEACVASPLPLLVISMPSCLPVLNM